MYIQWEKSIVSVYYASCGLFAETERYSLIGLHIIFGTSKSLTVNN